MSSDGISRFLGITVSCRINRYSLHNAALDCIDSPDGTVLFSKEPLSLGGGFSIGRVGDMVKSSGVTAKIGPSVDQYRPRYPVEIPSSLNLHTPTAAKRGEESVFLRTKPLEWSSLLAVKANSVAHSNEVAVSIEPLLNRASRIAPPLKMAEDESRPLHGSDFETGYQGAISI
jgi:hypothetical protein